jgi:hypothetical protein
VAVLGLGLVPLTASPAAACSCAAQLSDREYAAEADAVFVGRVDDVDPTGWTSGSSTDRTVATFVVDEVYKGEIHTYTDVVTARSGASCGIDPVAGQTLLVFADYGGDGIVAAEADELRASMCAGTRVVGAAPVLPLAGHAPIAGQSAPVDSGFPTLGWLGFGAVAGLGLLPIALWLRMSGRFDGH